jgi:hypothetical protein
MPIPLTYNFSKATEGRSITVYRYRLLLALPCLWSKDSLEGASCKVAV